MSLLQESIMVGVMVIVAGFLVSWLYSSVMGSVDLTDTMQFASVLFLIGVVVHVFSEYSGINKAYCSMGNACVRH